MKPVSIIWPGVEAAVLEFANGVNATLGDGGDEVYLPITTNTLPTKAQNEERIRALPFCAKTTAGDDDADRFTSSGLFINLRKSTCFGVNLKKAWWGQDDNAWWHYAKAKYDQVLAWTTGSLEEVLFNLRARLWHHQPNVTDRWIWSKAAESMAFGASYMRILFQDASTIREFRKGGFENRYVPIAHHMLPAITMAGRVYDSRDNWIDSRLVGEGERQCQCPGVHTFLN
jgi:hypothetical protein